MAYKKVNRGMDLAGFWYKFQKPIITVVAILVIGVLGIIGYKKFIQGPKAERANIALANVQAAFQAASLSPRLDTAAYKTVLEGRGTVKGALSVIRNYGGTDAGNLAKFYAGESYLHLGDFKNAVKYLKDFHTSQKQVQMMVYGSLGDAYSELKQNKDAVASYKKAATTFEDDQVNASEYLFRAGMLSELDGKTKDAVAIYQQLKNDFPNTIKGMQADKYLNRLELQPIN